MSPRFLSSSAIVAFLLLAVACGSSSRYRPGWQGEGRAWFDAEWIQGYASDGSAVATLSVSVPRRNLVFFVDDGHFESRYRIRCVQRSGDRLLRSQEWGGAVAVERYADTRSDAQEQKTVQFAIDPAAREDLQLVVSLSVEGTQRAATRVLSAERVRRGESGLGLSGLRLYVPRAGVPVPREPIALGHGELPDAERFVAAGSGGFDQSTGAPWLFVQVFDLRGEAGAESFPLSVRLEPGRGVAGEELQMRRLGVESALLLPLDPAHFAFGENEITVEVAGELSTSVKMHNLGVDLEDERSWEANLAHVEGLVTSQALQRLRAAEAGTRGETWHSFWERLDSTPGDGVNQRLREHYRRVQHARRYLRDGAAAEALSDRGRTYVLHGEPTRVEDVPPRWDDPTVWQIWHYESLQLVFYFRQVQGGFFRMVGSERA